MADAKRPRQREAQISRATARESVPFRTDRAALYR